MLILLSRAKPSPPASGGAFPAEMLFRLRFFLFQVPEPGFCFLDHGPRRPFQEVLVFQASGKFGGFLLDFPEIPFKASPVLTGVEALLPENGQFPGPAYTLR